MRKVLVVDDEPDIRLMSRYMLEANGFEVLEAGDGSSGLEMMRAHSPALVLLDIRMPGADGWAVLREILDDPQLSTIPVIMASAHATPSEREPEDLKDRAGYLVKPFRQAELMAALEKVFPS